MARLGVVTFLAATFYLATSSCGRDPALFTSITLPALGDAGPLEPEGMGATPASGGAGPLELEGTSTQPASGARAPAMSTGGLAGAGSAGSSASPSVQPSAMDAGASEREPDASPAPEVPRPVVVAGATVELPLLGVAGGDPRLGVCQGGLVIGVRTTANPSEEVFGQRLTFIEPICGKALQQRPSSDPAGTIGVTRDDSLIDWATTDLFFGVPPTEVPDPRLVWVPQPATVCPEATPVVVGLSGEYDPVAPDVMDTAAIRSLFIECAPLQIAANGSDVVAADSGHQLISNADSFAATGTATYRSACEGGAVTTQFQVHAGFWLDGFALGCSRLRLE
jgi:hypothetical protein